MSTTTLSPLRQRMIEDMSLRNLAPRTQEAYTRGDPTEKLDAMEAIVPPHLRRGAFQPSDKLITLLKRAS